jgi:hypothetical protein
MVLCVLPPVKVTSTHRTLRTCSPLRGLRGLDAAIEMLAVAKSAATGMTLWQLRVPSCQTRRNIGEAGKKLEHFLQKIRRELRIC